MKVSKFKNATTREPDRYSISILDALDRIKNGSLKNEINELRVETSKVKKDELKKSLSAVTFGGEFTTRSKAGLKESSGFMIIDFDKLDNPIEFRENLKLNDYIYSAWISPSGNGVKALVKIPKVVNSDQYTSYYIAFIDALNEESTDASGKDISRLCFESYDADLWINEDSQLWVEFDSLELEQPIYHHDDVTVPLTDEDEIVSRLLKWFEKHYKPTERNNSINNLAYSFNLFGVDKQRCEAICLRYEQKDFKKSEILATVNSAYKKTNLFGSKQFQDFKRQDKIVNFSRGKTIQEIRKKFPDVSNDFIDKVKKNENIEEFWEVSDKGKIFIIPSYFRNYLHSNGVNKLAFDDNVKVVSFIKRNENFIEEWCSEQIKDFVLTNLENNGDMDVWNELASKPKYFTDEFLSMVSSKEIDTFRDTINTSYIYYQNCILQVTKDTRSIIDYKDVDKLIWKNQVIKRDYKDGDHHDSDFRSFIWFACGESKEYYNVFKSVIGYFLHTYKTVTNNKAIIANDTDFSDQPNGGSGKSLLFQALGHIRKVAVIDGKDFNFQSTFKYQTVGVDTQILVFDDIEKNFEFERLFSAITDGITVEYKNKNATKLNIEDSPKLYITTNYVVKGEGGSFDRRKNEIVFSSFFNSKYTPEDKFENRFFTDWNEKQWSDFDNFMINCLQFYLENGLLVQDGESIRDKRFVNLTHRAWYEFVTQNPIELDKRIYLKELKLKFLEINDHFRDFTTPTLRKYVREFAKWKHLNIIEDKDVTGYYFELNNGVEKASVIDEDGKIDLSGIDLN
jgi:hypothetical protein